MSAPPLRAPDDVLVHLRRARDHIDRHYAEPLDLASLAAVAGISRYHFQRLFTATYGVSPAAGSGSWSARPRARSSAAGRPPGAP